MVERITLLSPFYKWGDWDKKEEWFAQSNSVVALQMPHALPYTCSPAQRAPSAWNVLSYPVHMGPHPPPWTSSTSSSAPGLWSLSWHHRDRHSSAMLCWLSPDHMFAALSQPIKSISGPLHLARLYAITEKCSVMFEWQKESSSDTSPPHSPSPSIFRITPTISLPITFNCWSPLYSTVIGRCSFCLLNVLSDRKFTTSPGRMWLLSSSAS